MTTPDLITAIRSAAKESFNTSVIAAKGLPVLPPRPAHQLPSGPLHMPSPMSRGRNFFVLG